LEAFSDANPDDSRYSRITFCNDFFKLNTFQDAMTLGKKLKAKDKTNLIKWNNRARCFFHEVTHLDYFMNAGAGDDGKSPYVSDLEVNYPTSGKNEWHACYGPYNAKVLRNWVPEDAQYSGYFTQRNADNYAYFALAKYVQKQIGKYPSSPSPGRKKPTQEPRDAKSHEEPQGNPDGLKKGQDRDLLPGPEQDPDDTPYPGCPDRVGTYVAQAAIVSSISSQHASHPTSPASKPPPSSTPHPKTAPKCDDNALSGVPYNVFSGSAGTVYGKFCDAVGKAQRTKLTWHVDSSGNQKKPSKRLRWLDERTPPPAPSQYKSFTFELDWAPASGKCNTNCKDAYAAIAESPCGHQGGQHNAMTAAASLAVGCGTYSYKITGAKVPPPAGPPAPSLSAQYCYPASDFGKHVDVQSVWQSEYTGWACASSTKENFKPGDKHNWNTTTNGVPYNYNIWWTPGCTSSVTPMNVYQPLAGNKDANCLTLMQNNYKKCSSPSLCLPLCSDWFFGTNDGGR
jgi:hypothetical protein